MILALAGGECQPGGDDSGRIIMSSSPLQFTRARADNRSTMRTHGFRTHILLVLVGALGAVASLSRPWYGPQPAPSPDNSAAFDQVHGPLYDVLHGARRWVTDSSGTTGWDSLGISGSLLAGIGLIVALAALASILPAVQGIVRDPLRYGAFAMFALCLWRLVDTPGPNDRLELRSGALMAALGSLVAWISAQAVVNAPSRRRAPARTYTPPPPPAYEFDGR
jgi:hypothetical protein